MHTKGSLCDLCTEGFTLQWLTDHLSGVPDWTMAVWLAVQTLWWWFGVPFWFHVFGRLFRRAGWFQRLSKKTQMQVQDDLATVVYYTQSAALMWLGTQLADAPGECVHTRAFWYGTFTQIGHDIGDLGKLVVVAFGREVPRYPHTSPLLSPTKKPMWRRTTKLSFAHHAGVFTCFSIPVVVGAHPTMDFWWCGAPASVVMKNLYNAAQSVGEELQWHPFAMLVLHAAGFVAWTVPRAIMSATVGWIVFTTAGLFDVPWPAGPGLQIWQFVWVGMMYTIYDNSRKIAQRVPPVCAELRSPPGARRAPLLGAPVVGDTTGGDTTGGGATGGGATGGGAPSLRIGDRVRVRSNGSKERGDYSWREGEVMGFWKRVVGFRNGKFYFEAGLRVRQVLPGQADGGPEFEVMQSSDEGDEIDDVEKVVDEDLEMGDERVMRTGWMAREATLPPETLRRRRRDWQEEQQQQQHQQKQEQARKAADNEKHGIDDSELQVAG